MAISIIAAVSKNNVIGNKGKLPWYLPRDMAYFLKKTKGRPVIMGRKTFESIGKKPLPGRTNIVVTRKDVYAAPGCHVAHSLNEAVFYASISPRADDIFIIGGTEIYKEGLYIADRLYITRVDCECEGDAFFPEFDDSLWKEILREDAQKDAENEFAHSYIVYERLNASELYNRPRIFRIAVEVMTKKGVLDPQGRVVKDALIKLEFTGIEDMRIGKLIKIEVTASNKKEAEERVRQMCDTLLANPVIEEYKIWFEESFDTAPLHEGRGSRGQDK